MTTQLNRMPIFRSVVAVVPGGLGWLVYCAAAWLVHHDSVNYRLYSMGCGFVSLAAEVILTFGPIPPVLAGLVLGLPSVVGWIRQVRSLLRLTGVNALAGLTLLGALGSATLLPLIGLLGVTAVLWILASVWAAASPEETAHPGAPPDSDPAAPPGSSSTGPTVV